MTGPGYLPGNPYPALYYSFPKNDLAVWSLVR